MFKILLKHLFACIWFSFHITLLFSQVIDHFSDGDFMHNPEWNGNSGSFIINAENQLQLDTIGASQKYLYTQSEFLRNTEWEFWIKLNFDPSANNVLKIYLASDQSNLSGSLHGYFIKIGENLSNDAIELYRQDGVAESLIGRGINGNVASKPTFRLKIICDSSGNWDIFSDLTGDQKFQKEFSTFDSTFKKSSFLGIFCKFTSSNSKSFVFDDIYAGPMRIDTIPPKAISISAENRSRLRIVFNEELDTLNLKPNFFRLLTGFDSAKNIYIVNNTEIIADFYPLLFNKNKTNFIAIDSLTDIVGNQMTKADTLSFIFLDISYKNLVINEIMADPSPSIDLPDKEFIELYNTLDIPISLNGWTVEDGSSKSTIGSIQIAPRGFIILCNASDTSLFKEYGFTHGFFLPSLNNSFDKIVLKDNAAKTIDSVLYTDSWHKDILKQGGGWSLELINPYFNCKTDENNWLSSSSTKGGSPGEVNSVIDTSIDLRSPIIRELFIIDSNQILVLFNEKLNPSNPPLAEDISITNLSKKTMIYQVTEAFYEASEPTSLPITFNHNLLENCKYKLEIKDVNDCQQPPVSGLANKLFFIPDKVDSFDIVINEILFNPHPYSFDFIELYNRSNKIIDLKTLFIANLDDSLRLKQIEKITDSSIIFEPDNFFVLTENPEDIKNRYLVKYPEKILQISKLPSFSDDKGNAVILDSNLRIIDYLSYNSQMHFQLMDNEEGVSLERVDPEQSTQMSSNWKSASSSSGYATPTYKNSQQSDIIFKKDEICIEPEIFSPDNDGINDYLKISYHFQKGENFGTIRIFDLSGKLVKNLAQNDLFGIEGFFTWGGTDDDERGLTSGIYIIVIEVVNSEGSVKKWKKSCTLAR